MITNPKNGWCNFKLRTFEGTPSYLTDVPVDLLMAFIDYHTKGCGIAWFDEEGTEFSLVITPYSVFIIEEKDTTILHDFSEMKIENIEKELIEDIEKIYTVGLILQQMMTWRKLNNMKMKLDRNW